MNSFNRFIHQVYYNASDFKKVLSAKHTAAKSTALNALISANEQFNYCEKGKRCFIVGGDVTEKMITSLKGSDELIMTVGDFVFEPFFEELNPRYHIFGKGPLDEKRTTERIKAIAERGIRTVFFFPLEHYSFARANDLQSVATIRYYSDALEFRDGYTREFNLSEFTNPSFPSLLQLGAAFAVYMGSKSVYLLGCLGEKTAERVRDARGSAEAEKLFFSLYKTLHLYEALLKYCMKRHVSLVSCSEGSYVTHIPFEPLEKVLKDNSKSEGR